MSDSFFGFHMLNRKQQSDDSGTVGCLSFLRPLFVEFALAVLLLKKVLRPPCGTLSSIVTYCLQLKGLVSGSSTPAKKRGADVSSDSSDVYVPFVILLRRMICIESPENM